MPTTTHPHPLDAKQPARKGEHPRGYQAPIPCATTAPTPTPQPLPATGQGRAQPARRGTARGTRTTQADNATRRTLHRCNDVEHNSKHDKVYEHNSVRAAAMKQASNNGIEHSTLRHGHAELSDATKQREEHCITASDSQHDKATRAKQRSNTTTQREEHCSINNTMQQGCDSTGEQSASHKPTFTKASTR